MRIRRWLFVLPALLPAALVTVGCEDDDGGPGSGFSLDAGGGFDVLVPEAAALVDAADAGPPTTCTIDDAGFDAGVIDPADLCHVCDPTRTATAWASRGTVTLLSGKAEPATEGWSTQAMAPNDTTRGADYVRLATSTAGSTSGQNLLYRSNAVPVGKAFTLRVVLQVESVDAHNQYDSAAAIMGSFTPPFGTTPERAEMVYLDTAALGWADDSASKPFATTDGAYHTYVLSVDAVGGAKLSVDGATLLTRTGYATNGTVAIGDQTNEGHIDGALRIRSVERVCP